MLRSALILLGTTLSLLVIDLTVPGVNIANFPAALIAAIVLGAINSGLKPVLSLLSLPLNLVTLGGFSLVVNGICFWLASLFVPDFTVSGLLAIILGPVVLSFVNTFLNRYFTEKYPTLTKTEQ
jgi:putative membrane protein